ncbi:MAG: bifunctional glutamate N-acetyltransferase/amino-acid acetyltransferase ArgJ [Gammaproteobacteria bacterium]|nr:bifunctional glutamate N-acetyltransferase/amino-acid acetyltransferase ArgJ [Gammaproteobacteria bacterium]
MAVGDTTFPNMYPVAGVRLGVTCAGIKKQNRRDLVVIELAEGSQCVGVFTRNAFCAAPVVVAREHLLKAMPRYFVINTGNANAGTGDQGLQDAHKTCEVLSDEVRCLEHEVLPFSTGVIGENLNIDALLSGIPAAISALGKNNWEEAAHGIMTTDTVPKGVSQKITLDGNEITITGIVKGSGMIRPDMATMLAFVCTDAQIEKAVLKDCLKKAITVSFNRITIDGDTSTNDAAMLVATGRAEMQAIKILDSERGKIFLEALINVFTTLAQLIVRDGEGATKFITIDVNNAKSVKEAEDVAFTVAHSPLVKTAFFASDPNWGRILAAVGRAGIDGLNLKKINIYLDDVCIVENGGRAASYTEEQGQAVMKKDEIKVKIDLGRGDDTATIWTSDLSYEYVKINAEYRT